MLKLNFWSSRRAKLIYIGGAADCSMLLCQSLVVLRGLMSLLSGTSYLFQLSRDFLALTLVSVTPSQNSVGAGKRLTF